MTNWKALAIGLIIAVLIDIIAAYALVFTIGGDESGRMLACLLIVGLVWAVQIYVGIKGLAIAVLFKQDTPAKNLAAMLSKEGFPPAKAHDTAHRYLDRIIDSYDDDDDRLRMRASFFKGEMAGIAAGGVARSLTMNTTWDKAIHYIE